jgi:hypothetical protein
VGEVSGQKENGTPAQLASEAAPAQPKSLRAANAGHTAWPVPGCAAVVLW